MDTLRASADERVECVAVFQRRSDSLWNVIPSSHGKLWLRLSGKMITDQFDKADDDDDRRLTERIYQLSL